MIVLGLVGGHTTFGRPLKDGAAALMIDGTLTVAIAEERLSRRKRAGGWTKAAPYCLSAAGLDGSDVDIVAISTCCDSASDSLHRADNISRRFPKAVIVRVEHHVSHAWHAYLSSGFTRALVAISDAGGNTFESTRRWWEVEREQTTYFDCRADAIDLIDRDFVEPGAAGFGETFRAFTYFLGWPSGSHANKTMALSGLGDPHRLALAPLFERAIGCNIRSPIVNDPKNPIAMVDRFLRQTGLDIEPRTRSYASSDHAHLAAHLQHSYEEALIERVREHIRTGDRFDGVCLGGGVAYNCQANSALVRDIEQRPVHVPQAPGDTGQAIGNAAWAAHFVGGEQIRKGTVAQAHLGRPLGPATGVDLSDLVVDDTSSPVEEHIANWIAEGRVVGVCSGRSEFGARALGNRSILGDPRTRKTSNALNRRKGREPWMPFAGVMRLDRVDQFFTPSHPSPFMQFVFASRHGDFPAILHSDGTSRLQTISDAADTERLDSILRHFESITGSPLLLNTSLNGPGEPIVEEVSQAVTLLRRGIIDVLVTGEYVVHRKTSRRDHLAVQTT